MLDCHSGTLHQCECKGSQPLPVQQTGLIMTLRSEIIMCIPTNTGILHLNEQLYSWSQSLSLMVSSCNKYPLLMTFQNAMFDCLQSIWGLCFFSLFFQSLSLLSPFFLLSPKDTTVSGIKAWLWFGFSKAMSHAGLFSPQWASEWSICPHTRSVGPALPTLLIAGDVLDLVQLTQKQTRYIIVQRGTSGDQTEADFV